MATVDVDSGSLYRRTRSPSRLAWSEGRRPLGAVLHSSNEPGELSQWLCHDDSTISIVLDIIIWTGWVLGVGQSPGEFSAETSIKCGPWFTWVNLIDEDGLTDCLCSGRFTQRIYLTNTWRNNNWYCSTPLQTWRTIFNTRSKTDRQHEYNQKITNKT